MEHPGYYIEDLELGATASMSKTVSEADIAGFAEASGDYNPLHMDEAYARQSRFGSRIAHGILTAGFISAVLANELPGPGSTYVSQTLRFKSPVRIGDTVTATATVTRIRMRPGLVTFKTEAFVGETLVLTGEAVAHVPSRPDAL